MGSSHKADAQIMKEQLAPKVTWLETEDFDEARVFSENSFHNKEINQWQIYLNALAQIGFKRYLKERKPNIKVHQDNRDMTDNTCYLTVDEFRICLIVADNFIDEYAVVPAQFVTSSQKAAHFYVLLEVLEEEQQLSIYGFLRYDELVKHSQFLLADSYQLPLSLLDTELNNLLLYTRFLSASAIKLPSVNNALVNLGKWVDKIFEEIWISTESIWSEISTNSEWGYVRKQNHKNNFHISQTKIIEPGLLSPNKSFALTVNLKIEDGERDVLLQVFPYQEKCLPFGLKLKITLNPNTPESVSREAIARQADNAIQLEFSEAPGKQFQVEISYQDAVITEGFIF